MAGHNKIKNHPAICEHNATIHAEHDALRKHPNPKNSTCIVIRLDQNEDIAYSRPCAKCEKILREEKVKRVIYSDPDSESGFREMIL